MEQTFLIVGYRMARYAIDAEVVQEVVWLPELCPIEEMPPFIRGVFNLRGHVVPVLDLGMRFGYGLEQTSASDRVVVVTESGHRIGIVVHDVHDVVTVHADAVEPVSNFQVPGGQSRFLSGAVKQDDTLLMLLDRTALLNQAMALEPLGEPPAIDAPRVIVDAEVDVGAEVFRARSRELARIAYQQDDAERKPYALVRLGGELFGLEVGVVREFVHLNGLTPVPCAPAHVAGHVNLRGDILVIVDIRPLLGVSVVAPAGEVAVMRVADMPFGILAEGIEEINAISDNETRPAQASGRQDIEPICLLVAKFDCGFASLIDTDRLMGSLHAGQSATTLQ
jgi:purine-binding chemotaxis protein CheW